jgi:hypothetical protein
MQVFVVVRVGYEYNDENYYRPESEGGLPIKVFDSKEEANDYCREANINEFRRLGTPGKYGMELSTYDYDHLDGVNFNEETTDFEIMNVMKNTKVRFFEVHKTEKA